MSTVEGPDTSGVGTLARLPSGRRTKWLVVAFWLLVAGLAFGPSASLTDAQKNDASAWLPSGAESTKVIDAASSFQSENEAPAVIVYERAAGVTPADLASVTAQVSEFNAIAEVKKDRSGRSRRRTARRSRSSSRSTPASAGWEAFGAVVDDMRAHRRRLPGRA